MLGSNVLVLIKKKEADHATSDILYWSPEAISVQRLSAER